jgi:hypothetical protein
LPLAHSRRTRTILGGSVSSIWRQQVPPEIQQTGVAPAEFVFGLQSRLQTKGPLGVIIEGAIPSHWDKPTDLYSLSLDLTYTTKPWHKLPKLSPFLMAGYTHVGTACGGSTGPPLYTKQPCGGEKLAGAVNANRLNFGAGATYWLKPWLGLRFELRDNYKPTTTVDHALSYRGGVVFPFDWRWIFTR